MIPVSILSARVCFPPRAPARRGLFFDHRHGAPPDITARTMVLQKVIKRFGMMRSDMMGSLSRLGMVASTLLLLAVLSPPALAASHDGTHDGAPHTSTPALQSPWLADLTGFDVREQIKDARTVILVPVGGIVALGPHLTLGAQNKVLASVTEAAARQDGHSLITPLIPMSPVATDQDTENLRWTGTLFASRGSVTSLLGETIASLKMHGARRFLLITNNPLALPALRDTAASLSTLWAEDGIRVTVAEEVIDPARDAILLKRAHLPADAQDGDTTQSRGGTLETAEVMACCSEDLRRATLPRTARARDVTGVQGRPDLASEKLGLRSLTARMLAITDGIAALRSP